MASWRCVYTCHNALKLTSIVTALYTALFPHIKNYYRYGTMRDCSYKWADFKYCMSLKGEDEEEKRKLWIKRKAEWWAGRRVGGSSEDVWNVRT